MSIRAILFDLDGTLLHTVPDLAAAVNAMLRDLALPELDEATVATYVGKGAENLIHRSLTGSLDGRADAALFEKANAIWHAHYEQINGQHAEFYPGVLEGLEAFAQAGLKLAVVTNKPERFTGPLLARSGIACYFSVVIGGDTFERKKPDPLPVLKACERLGVSPSEALFIGDSLNDAQAARAAGVPCWLLPYGYNEGRPIESTPCDGHINTLLQAAERVCAQQPIQVNP
ncbi:phosphoglycolate phosphatase [Limnobacter humi]|uniref:Phosphoglycolate phosphatase n=1 Tax=Limnobacter humi TaxID=1778671 RepID=A0ABT1WJA4_9BURK|nr:phosphoglycolate phosphatase [Limnobacter humi]MCQ8897602.1 phosphoglycolate phosphatase [Limnobacter humi]